MILACGFCTGRTRKKIFLKKSRQLKIFFSSSPVSSRLREHCRSWLSLNSSPSSGEATPLGDSTVSPLYERWCRSTLVRGDPSRYRLRRLRLRYTAPRYRNSASVSLFISHPASFPSRVSSAMSIMSFHTEIPARNSSTTTFTELRDRILAT